MDTADHSWASTEGKRRATGLNLCAATNRTRGRNGFAAAAAGGDFSSNSPAGADAKANTKQ